MSHRVVQIGIDDITATPERVAETLTGACARPPTPHLVVGVCQTGSRVFFPLEPAADGRTRSYVLAPFSGTGNDEVLADLQARWQSGFVTRGLIHMEDGASYIGVFERVGD